MKKQIISAKNFVVDHKMQIVTTIAIAATSIAVLEQLGIQSHNKFLKEKNLYDEYYTPDMD